MATIATSITGLCQALLIDGNPVGLVTGGTLNGAVPPVHRRGQGGIDRRAGAFFTPGGTVNFIPTEDIGTFIQTTGGKVKRAATGYPCSALPTFALKYIGESVKEYTGCKVQQIELSASMGDPLAATLEFMGTGLAASTGTAGTPGQHWEWFDATVTLESVAYSVEGFSATLENALTPSSDLDGFGVGVAHRLPKRVFEGDESVRLQLRTKNEIPLATLGNVADDIVTNLTFVATFTNAAAGTLVITADNLCIAGDETPMEGEDGIVVYSYSFEGATNGNSLTIAYTAPA